MRKIAVSVSFALALAALTPLLPAFAASGDTTPPPATANEGTIRVEQYNSAGVLGKWTLILPTNEQRSGESDVLTMEHMPTGTYTIFAESPEGANATVRRYVGTSLEETVSRGQLTFNLEAGQTLKITVHYTFIRVGTVSVHSDPPGMVFELTGPNETVLVGETPASYEDVPEGQYAVQFKPLEGCVTPPRQSHMLEKGGRVTFDVTIACKSADKLRDRLDDPEDKVYVTITINGEEVTLRDVPRESWFATFVFDAARLNVISGYKDAEGNPTGEFGPDRPVTVGELAAMTQRASGLFSGEVRDLQPVNERARNQWYSPFIAYAEQHGWTIYADAGIDPNRPATRGEVLVTLLQAMNVPLRWQTGTMFTDVSPRTAFASAIETGAGDGVVTGYTDANGDLTGAFGPKDNVTRAQMAKILVTAIDLYRTTEEPATPNYR